MYLFFDTETTGLNRYRDHVVQVAWILVNQDQDAILEESHIIQPEGYVIPRQAADIHGISTGVARANGKPLNSVLQKLSAAADRAHTIIAHNLSFDLSILENDYKNSHLKFPFHGKTRVCTMKLSTTWCRLPKLNGGKGFKWPKLVELHYRLFGKSFDGEHDAMADTRACMRCYFKLVDFGVITPPPNQKPKQRSESVSKSTRSRGPQKNKRLADIRPATTCATINNLTATKKPTPVFPARSNLKISQQYDENLIEDETFFEYFAKDKNPKWRARVAGDPLCPISILSALAYDASLVVQEAIISNPSVTSEVLEHVLESDNWRVRKLLLLIAGHAKCPRNYFEKISLESEEDEELDLVMAQNPSCPPEILAQLKYYATDTVVARAADNNPSYSNSAYVDLIVKFISDMDIFNRLDIAKDKMALPEELAVLSKDRDYAVRVYVARNPRTPADVLLQLSGRRLDSGGYIPFTFGEQDIYTDRIAAEARGNPSNPLWQARRGISPERLDELSRYESTEIRRCVGGNKDASHDTLFRLSRDKDASVRIAVVENPHTRESILEELAEDIDSGVRAALARNSRTSDVALAALASDFSSEVRSAVANNTNTPQSVFAILAEDTDWAVVAEVVNNANTPRAVVAHVARRILFAKELVEDKFFELIVDNPKCPKAFFSTLCAHGSPRIREAAARNPNCSVEGLRVLASSTIYEWRELAAQHPNCPPDLLGDLAKDPVRSVRKAAIKNAACPLDIRAPLFMAEAH